MRTPATEYAIEKAALRTFGDASQIQKTIEECAELIDALCKFRYARCTREDVITEIADVLIMAEQMALTFGEADVESEKKRKLARLQERIDEANSYKK